MEEKSSKKKNSQKRHVCVFCHAEFDRIFDHLTRKHKNEERVIKIKSIKNTTERRWLWKQLTREGDFNFNKNLKVKSKEITVKTPLFDEPLKKYFDCEYCFGRLRYPSRKRHLKRCLVKRLQEREKLKKSLEVLEEVPDEVTVKLADSEYACQFLKTFSDENESDMKNSRAMAVDLVHLEDFLKKSTQVQQSLAKFLVPQHVENVVKSIKILGEEIKVGRDVFLKFPSRAQRFCRLVVNFSKFLQLFYGKKSMEPEYTDAKKFLELFVFDTETRLKRQIYRSTKFKQLKTPKKLPKTQDITELINLLKEETPILVKNLNGDQSEKPWRKLAENILCRLTVFNRLRGGAVEKMKIADYLATETKKLAEIDETLFDLNEEDEKFLEEMKIVEIINNNDVTPIYISKELQECMNILLEKRASAKINPENKYFFAAGKGSLNPIRGVHVLEKYRKYFPPGVKESLTATNFRKHGATTAQMLNLSPQEQEVWKAHIGHSLDVYKRRTRHSGKADSVLKTARILSALDSGALKNFKGKSIDEIPLTLNDADSEEDEPVPGTSGLSHD